MPGIVPAERMAVEVTYPVEEAIRAVPGLLHIRSTTSRGSADLSIFFEWGRRHGLRHAPGGVGH